MGRPTGLEPVTLNFGEYDSPEVSILAARIKSAISASSNNTTRAFILCRVTFPLSAQRKIVRGHTPSRPAIVRALLNLLSVPLAPGEASSSFCLIPETKSSDASASMLRTYRVFGSGQYFRSVTEPEKWPRNGPDKFIGDSENRASPCWKWLPG